MGRESETDQVRSALSRLGSARLELEARLADSQSVDEAGSRELAEQFSTVRAESQRLEAALSAWLEFKPGAFRKRPSAQQLLEQAGPLEHALSGARDRVLALATIPNRIMADIASTLSRISVTEQQIGSLTQAGGDAAACSRLMAQLREQAGQVKVLADAGEYLQARSLSSSMSATAAQLSSELREQQNQAAQLTETLVQARALARAVNDLARRAAQACSDDCPASQASLDDLSKANRLFNTAVGQLEPLGSGPFPAGSTTTVRNANESLESARLLLERTLEFEQERNWSWRECMSLHETIAEVVTALARKGMRTDSYWLEMDAIAALLASGSVLDAAPRQAALLLDVTVAHRPALASAPEAVPNVSRPTGEQAGDYAARLDFDEPVREAWAAIESAPAQGVSTTGELDADADGESDASRSDEARRAREREDMAHLRNLVTAMADEVRALRGELA